jgi:hypothetical protein
MMQRRSRVIVFFQSIETLAALKGWAGRTVELIAACDVPTVTAALKLYGQLNAVIAEVTGPKSDAALGVLRLAASLNASIPRVLVTAGDVPAAAYPAVHDRTATALLFAPLGAAQLSEACLIAPAPPVLLPERLRHPPLTGGMRASSSPSLSR